ncbi:MAG TPA: hypothetical protein DD670_12375, partial [Planctomycetaceae bacterium]|nr:hypothetical protein [Planctomycetaceae bacterium]
ILCPFSGEWVVTQGFDGRFTHQGEWRHALDFEVMDGSGRRYSGSPQRLDNFYTFNTPVLSPAMGTVFKTVDHIADRPPGSNNFANPWGNLVILRLDTGQYVKLCHLRNRSLCVKEGQRVKPGDAVGYCGNSGRSPVPHLHVQVQTTAQVGATTVPFRLRHYVERSDGESVYHVAGIPAEDARVQAAIIDSRIAKYFDNISRREYTYRLQYLDHESHETISCRVDHFGSYVFESSAGNRLTASVQDQVFHAFDHEGGPGVLYWLWLGLGRVPFIANPRTHWHDVVDLHPMLRAWAKLLLDINDPFFGYRSVEVTRSFEPPDHDGGEARPNICLATTFRHETSSLFVAKNAIPRQIQTYVSESNWVARIVVNLDRPLTIQQV